MSVNATFTGDPIAEQTAVPVNINVDVCGGKVVTENMIVDKASRGLANVVVRLDGITSGPREVGDTVVVNNKDCSFVPHVSVAVKGQKLQFTKRRPDPAHLAPISRRPALVQRAAHARRSAAARAATRSNRDHQGRL